MTPDGALDPHVAGPLLADLGFLVVPDVPGRDDPAYLLVALRAQPSLRHFDPERVDHWVTVKGRGVATTIDRTTTLPMEGDFSWGPIRVVDRLNVSNEYLTFGGRLSAASVGGIRLAVFRSSAPLLERGGHSQGWDPMAPQVAAYFARLRAAAGDDQRFESVLSAADPVVRYGAFVVDAFRSYSHSDTLRSSDPTTWLLVRDAAARLRRDVPSVYQSAERLLAALPASVSGHGPTDH